MTTRSERVVDRILAAVRQTPGLSTRRLLRAAACGDRHTATINDLAAQGAIWNSGGDASAPRRWYLAGEGPDVTDEWGDYAEWATSDQRAAVEAYRAHGSVRRAAEALGITADAVDRRIRRVRRRLARRGFAPQHSEHVAPEGYSVKGTTTLYGRDGTPVLQWVKTREDREDLLARVREAVAALAEPVRGASDPRPAPTTVDADLLAVYPMGDPHLGLYAWAEETGEDTDLDLGAEQLYAAVDELVAMAPAAQQALILNLGDFLHSDSSDNRTRRAGHPLDVDGRWAEVLRVGVHTLRRCIDRALDRHSQVRVINLIGNHDDQSSVVLSLVLDAFYSREPRVSVDISPAAHHWLRWGRCLIGATHGDAAKPDQLPGLMAADCAADWGETRYRHWYTGHVHHDSVREYPGVTVETVRTLAARDAWASRAGYRSDRDMKCDLWHREHGRIRRYLIGIDRLRGVA